jgi:hypothetical protein
LRLVTRGPPPPQELALSVSSIRSNEQQECCDAAAVVELGDSVLAARDASVTTAVLNAKEKERKRRNRLIFLSELLLAGVLALSLLF